MWIYDNQHRLIEEWQYGPDLTVNTMDRHIWDAAGTQETFYQAWDRNNSGAASGPDKKYGTSDDEIFFKWTFWHFPNAVSSFVSGPGLDNEYDTIDDIIIEIHDRTTNDRGDRTYLYNLYAGEDQIMYTPDDTGRYVRIEYEYPDVFTKRLYGYASSLVDGAMSAERMQGEEDRYNEHGSLVSSWNLSSGADGVFFTADDSWFQTGKYDIKYDSNGREIWAHESDSPGPDKVFFSSDDFLAIEATLYPCP